jgi:hypothetical protein
MALLVGCQGVIVLCMGTLQTVLCFRKQMPISYRAEPCFSCGTVITKFLILVVCILLRM